MTKRAKRPRDTSQLAHMIVGIATGEVTTPEADTSRQREGGIKGGQARAKKLSAGRRREISKKAATKRWTKETTEE